MERLVQTSLSKSFGYFLGALLLSSCTGIVQNGSLSKRNGAKKETPPEIVMDSGTQILEDQESDLVEFSVGKELSNIEDVKIEATSSNKEIIPDENITFTLGSDGNPRVKVQPAPNKSGLVKITIRVTNSAGVAERVFSINVRDVNDPPVISGLLDFQIDEDTSIDEFGFNLADVDSNVASATITATSSNTALIPNSGIVLGGTEGNRTVAINPVANASGQATITLAATDGLAASTQTFLVVVDSVDDPPVLGVIADQSISEDGVVGPVTLSLSDVDTPLGDLTFVGSSDNTGLVASGGFSFGGDNTARTFTINPVANASGTAQITVQASDASSTVTRTFNLSVAAVNDTPSTSDIANTSTNEDTATSAISFTVSDIETAAAALTLTATSSNQTLLPDANISLGGSGSSRTITLTPAVNQNGTATVTVQVSDGGLNSTDTFVLTVNAVDDAPIISDVANQSFSEDNNSGAVSVTVSDIDSPVAGLTMSGSSSNVSLISDSNIVFGGSNGSRTVTLTPTANANGASTITISVSDGTSSVSDTFVATVNAVNDAPTISDVTNQSTFENIATSAIGFTVGDVESAAGVLTVSGTSSDQTLLPDANISIGGTGASRTVTLTPATGQTGAATVTLTVSDGSLTATDTFTFTVGAVDDPPTISDVANQSTNEDTATSALAITVGDAETAVASLTMSGSSNNQTLVPNANIVFGGSGASRTVIVTPAANQSGTATITIGVSDGTNTTQDTFTLNVNAVNDAPTISDVANQSTNEDTATSAIAFTISDAETAAASLTVTATSDTQGVVPDANISLGGSGASRTVTITPAANANGTATITLQVSDGSASATDTFVLTVNAVNDAPTISDVANQSTNEDTATSAIAITVGDTETAVASLTMSGSSSNQTLVPDANIVFGGSGASRTVTITPAANQAGTATITIQVDDGSTTASDTFVLTVNAVNDAPTISDVANQSTSEDTATGAIAFTIGDLETAAASLTVTASSDTQGVVPDANISLGGSGASRTITITPAADATGTATITLQVSDGSLSSTDTFVLTVNATNDPPVISDVANQSTNEDTATSAIAFTVSDTETAAGSLTVTASSNTQGVVPDANISLGGSGGSRTVTITPAANASGTATITLQVSDGTTSSADTFVLTVNAVNDAPTISDVANQSTNEDTATSAIAFTVGDDATAAGSLTVTASSDTQGVVPDANISLGGSGASRTVTITPVANATGTATITLQVSDGSLSSTDTFVLTVNAVNDSPTISNVADQSTNEDTATSAIAFTIGDAETAAASLNVTATSDTQGVVPDANISLGGSGSSRTITLTPAANASGTATITIQVSDGTATATDTFVLTVNAVNDTPTISDVANQSTNEDTATTAIAFTIGDTETAAASLTVTATSDTQGVVPDANISLGGSGASRTVTITPAANATGTATITLQVSDGSASATDSFVLTVSAVNDAPTISDVANQSTNEDTATSAIAFTIGDAETAAASLTVTATSDTQGVVPDANISLGGSGASRTVTITPAANASGTATITLQVSDGSASATDTFVLTVNAVNDAPTISDVANQSTNEDTATSALAITVGDNETAVASLTMSGSSSNQSVVPDANIVFGGSGASRTVTITPAANASGTATITLQVSDGSASATDTFVLTVNAVNDAPTISDIGNQSTSESTATGAIAFTIGDIETAAGSLTVSGTSSDTTLVPNVNISFGGSGASRTVTITPAAGLSGTSTITVEVSDGTNFVTDTFVLSVGSLDDPPTISDVANQSTNEDTATSAIAITVGDPDTALASLTMSGSSSNQSVVADGSIVFGGSGANRTVTITPVANANGTATITVQVSDGTSSASDTFVLTVNAVNDSPTISDVANQSTNEDTATSAIAFTISDAETAAASLTVTATSDTQGVVPDANISLGGSGASRTVTITPAANANGTATITLQVSDGSASATDTFVLTVNAVNDAPTISDVANQSTNEDTATSAIAVTVGDNETAAGSLTVTATSNSQGVVPDANISLGGSGSSRTVTITPAANASGTATITLQVSDGSLTATDTFVLTVNAVNDAPTISDVANQTTNEDTATSALAITVGDIETAAASLIMSGSSSNQSVVPDSNIVFGGSGSSRTVTIAPAANASGTATITIGVSDGTATTQDTFTLTVNAVNDTPTISNVANQSTNEDTATGAIAFTIGDVETAAASLTVTASSDTQGVVPDGNIALGGSGTSRTVTITPAANANGTATITLQVSDGSLSATDTFVLTVNAVNDAPTISDVANQTTNEDTATSALAVTVGDTETAAASLTMSGSSSNQTLVPDANIVFGGSGTSRTVTVTPAANQSGTATITIGVSDGATTTQDTFTLTVNAVNDAPTISDVANQSTDEDTATSAIAFTIGDVETAAASLTVTATSNTQGVVPDANITLGGSGTSRTVTITPAANANGTATITLQVSDGSASATDTFVLTVNAVNDAPTITDVTNQSTNEDTATSAIAFTVGDYETAAGSLTVTRSSSNTAVVPLANVVLGGSGASRTVTITPAADQSGISTITLTVSDGTTSTNDTFVLAVNVVDDPPVFAQVISNQSGPEDIAMTGLIFEVSDIDSGVDGLSFVAESSNKTLLLDGDSREGKVMDPGTIAFTDEGGGIYSVDLNPATDVSGSSTITITEADSGINFSFTATFTAVNDAPTISNIVNRSTNEDTSTGAVAFTIADVETAAASLSVSGTSSNTTLVPNANIVFGGSGGSRTVTVTPAANQSGTSTITVTVSDGSLSSNDTFVLTVNAVNDAPVVSSISNQTIARNSTTGALAFTISDVETAAASLTLTGTSSNTTTVPNANITFGGSGGSRTVTVAPPTHKFGVVTITVGVSDGTTTTNSAFTLTVIEPQIEAARVLITYPHKDGFKVSKKDQSAFVVSGTCTLDDGTMFEVTDSGGYNTIDAECQSGAWSVTLDFSSASDSEEIYIMVDPSLKDFSTARNRQVITEFSYCDSTKESNSPFAAGAGTVGDPYMICAAAQLNQVRNYYSSHFQLRNTIDLADLGGNWTPHYFSGTFNGNDFQVKNLSISHNSDYGGLFQITNSGSAATFQNVHFYNVNITSTSGNCHGPISHLWGNTHAISNVSSHTGSVSIAGYGVGGVVGCVFSGGTVTDVFSDLTISTSETTTGQAGGIMGRGSAYTITRAAFLGTVSAPLCAGGVVGGGWGAGNSVVDSFSTGSVTITSGYSGAGGLMGCPNTGMTVSNSFATGSVTGGNTIGGLFGGTGSSTFTNTYAAVVMSGGTGVVGYGHDWGSNNMTSNYFDTQKSGTSNGWLGTGKTTAQLKDQTTFSGWDFTAKWIENLSIQEGPLLRWYSDQNQ